MEVWISKKIIGPLRLYAHPIQKIGCRSQVSTPTAKEFGMKYMVLVGDDVVVEEPYIRDVQPPPLEERRFSRLGRPVFGSATTIPVCAYIPT